MISTLQLLSAINTELDTVSARSYLNIAPQMSVYPFVVISVISTPTEYTFSTVMSDIRIQFSIFDNNSNMSSLLALASTVETTFEEYQNGGIYCSHIENERGPIYNEKEHYYQYDMDYIFRVQRAKI
jgi:hypothetical protein